jgi:hypothetical protein
MTAQNFRTYASQLSLQTIDERLAELTRAIRRDPDNSDVYEQQARLLREEVQRRQHAIQQHQDRFRMGLGPRNISTKENA